APEKCAAKAARERPVTSTTRSIPQAASSSTTHCTTGLPATGSSPLGTPRESGRRRVASPATGTTAVVMATGPRRLAAMAAPRLVAAPPGDAPCGAREEGRGAEGHPDRPEAPRARPRPDPPASR